MDWYIAGLTNLATPYISYHFPALFRAFQQGLSTTPFLTFLALGLYIYFDMEDYGLIPAAPASFALQPGISAALGHEKKALLACFLLRFQLRAHSFFCCF